MLALIVDTATAAVTVGVAQVRPESLTVLAEQVTVDARRHGEALAPAITAVLATAGARTTDLAAVVAGVGPGPFTGLRVGLVTAAALSDALAIPAYAVCTLDAIAHGVPGPLLVATDARRREVYWATYDEGGRRVRGPEVSKPADVPPGPPLALGSGAALYADVLGVQAREPLYPTVAGLARLAAGRILEQAPADPLTPLYLRRPDAVEPAARKPVLS